jgi:hypothetical protein
MATLSPGGHHSTYLTQGVEGVIQGACTLVVNIFLNPFWIGFKRLFEQNLLSRDSICREGFVNG